MKCSYSGPYEQKHFKKRRLMGSEKERALDSVINKGIAPSVYIRNEANRIMVEGKFCY